MISILHFIVAFVLLHTGIKALAVYYFFTVVFYLVVIVLIQKFMTNIKLETERSTQQWKDIAIDQLTGMYSSKYFQKNINHILKESNKEYYLIYADILNFSLYNKIFGEDKGSRLLEEFSNTLKDLSHNGAVYGRLFIDEFAILIPKESYNEERLIECIHNFHEKFSSFAYQIYAYAGVYKLEDNYESGNSICLKAKIALDTILGDYDRTIAYYNEDMLKTTLEKQKIIGEFPQALQEEQFCMFLQPQTTADGSLLGAEALIRWKHPEEGMIPPIKFIPILEETSMITMLDCFVWEQAAKQLKKWKQEGRDSIYISVNVSAMDFYYVDIYETFTSLVEKYAISPANLKIEITETVLMNDAKGQMKMLEKLQQYGFVIELDDFGSGYSSLSMLKDINVDVIKIDMRFLDETENKKRSWSILKNILQMAKDLEVKTVTEGVETKEQVDTLSEIGCKVFQGYYFAKPMEVEDFAAKYF